MLGKHYINSALSLAPKEKRNQLSLSTSMCKTLPGYVGKRYTPTMAGSLLKGYDPFYFDMTVSKVYYPEFYSFLTHAHVSLWAWGVG